MPLYEYQCRKCGRRWEKIRKFSDPPLTTCEACAGTLDQLISAPAIQFKGSGWYVTDYARKSSIPGGSAASVPTEKTAEKGSETSKPAEPSKAAEPAKASSSKD